MPSLSHDSVPVGIIGAGPTGLLSALLLARMGIRSMLFERREKPSPHPRSVGISRRTGEIFRQLGLTQEVEDRSLSPEGRSLAIWSRGLTGEELGRNPHSGSFEVVSPCSPLHCTQAAVEEVLLDAIQAEPLVTLCLKNELVAATGRPDGVRVSLLNPGGAGEYFFPYLIGADGAESTTRRLLDIAFDGHADKSGFLNVFFRADYGKALGQRKASFYHLFNGGTAECFVAINGADLWLMHHPLKAGETIADYPSERLADLILHASGLPEERVEIISAHQRFASPKIASRFRQGRTFLVGDAAARLSPFSGLGINIGLQSADNLAWKIAAVLNGSASETLLESYHTERRAASLATFNLTSDGFDEAIAQCAAEGDWQSVREKIKQSRLGGAGLGIDLGSGYEAGAFIAEDSPFLFPADPINDYLSNARPGSRAPHLWVQRGGKQVSTLDLFGQRFTLLVGRDGAAWHAAEPLACVVQNGKAFTDGGGDFEPFYGISNTGAVLIRPDGIVAARFKTQTDEPLETIRGVLKTILGAENLPESI